jgi:hypothetical protein
MASTYLSFTPGSAPTSSKIATISFWFKLSAINTNFSFFSANQAGLANPASFKILLRDANGRLELQQDDGSAGNHYSLRTNQLFRDASAWYHLVAAFDTTQATASNRIKLYINGSQVTSFSQEDYPTQNLDLWLGDTDAHNIGRDVAYGSSYYDGSMAHFHYTDGTAYDASAFGETDATTGIWKPKTAPSVTYGTNGFFLKFENSGAMGTDSSGNANNFTVNGNLTQNIDTPSNVFATFNALDNTLSQYTFSDGNLTGVYSGTNGSGVGTTSTLGVSSGKWYWEFKYTSATDTPLRIGITDRVAISTATTYRCGFGLYDWIYNQSDGNYYNNNSGTAYGDTYTTGDIIGVALDLDNNALYFSKNGTFQNSGVPTSGASKTGAISITAPASTNNGFYFAVVGMNSGSGTFTGSYNFGNGYFGTTAVASAQNPDDGIGIFEYSVPTGYKALCTKSINAQEYS